MSRRQGGIDALVAAVTSETDDRGQFRLFGLAPGQYYISAADPGEAPFFCPKRTLVGLFAQFATLTLSGGAKTKAPAGRSKVQSIGAQVQPTQAPDPRQGLLDYLLGP